jgi:hypothetical protein
MPGLQSGSQPQVPEYVNQPTDTDGWGMKLTLMVMGMLLVCFVFRRRSLRFWRGLMKT